jgi:membrane protease YdiL (CAAX protease family)
MEPLTRVQILAAMGVTALVLMLIGRFLLLFDSVFVLSVRVEGAVLLQGAGVGLGITVASALAYRWWAGYRQSADLYLKLVLQPLSWGDLLWMGLLPGLSEEFLFRGVLLPAIGLNGFGLVVSSLCFGILHLSSLQQWHYVVWATVIGFVLGASALLTGNLLVPIVAHIITNLISSIAWKLRYQAAA